MKSICTQVMVKSYTSVHIHPQCRPSRHIVTTGKRVLRGKALISVYASKGDQFATIPIPNIVLCRFGAPIKSFVKICPSPLASIGPMTLATETKTPGKRRIPANFFLPAGKKIALESRLVADTADRRPGIVVPHSPALSSESGVPGLRIIRDIISIEEEASILALLNGNGCQWRTDLSRRTMHFGGTYCLYARPVKGQKAEPPQMLDAPPLPSTLDWLVDRFVAYGIYEEIDNKRPEYVIVNEYLDKMGISAHTENFSFHSPVVGLSLGSADRIRFHEMAAAFGGSVRSGKAAKAPRTGKFVDVELSSRSLCVMSGDSRWKWQHEIRPIKRPAGFKRTSLTFRVKK